MIRVIIKWSILTWIFIGAYCCLDRGKTPTEEVPAHPEGVWDH